MVVVMWLVGGACIGATGHVVLGVRGLSSDAGTGATLGAGTTVMRDAGTGATVGTGTNS